LNEAAMEKKKKPSEMRFGGAKPEVMEIRGARALLFENDGSLTVYWQESGVGHTVTASMPRKELFEVIEDLL
jgi:anti-sigma factor RsiW